MICIIYWMYAIKSPICILPLPINKPPYHRTAKVATFIINIMSGITSAMVRFAFTDIAVRSLPAT
ncbi:hypothetical protein D3C73_1624200 [compost metagenome]